MNKIVIVGKNSPIEPLGILHLVGLAEQLGWEVKVVLVDDFDFQPLYHEVRFFRPNIVAFSIWTGYHRQSFMACDEVRKMGVPVVIGGPHATYFSAECTKHAQWVIKGEAFRNFRRLLKGELVPGIHFDETRMAEGFPVPGRDLAYNAYPHLAESPIKSIICSLGCPFRCSYCYALAYNKMYGGFRLNLRPIPQIINEALAIKNRWPLSMIYFQDDNFGLNIAWLAEFVREWKEKVGIPWHCQIRLELTRDERRIDLFREGGCTGITLAIESGNDFLRRFVLSRGMPDDLIVDGIKKIKDRGFALRTEQILGVPFSDIETDIQTLELNVRLNPEIAWTSILSPYGGTQMGAITSKYGFYHGGNDDLDDTFFNRSVLSHADGGPASIEQSVRSLVRNQSHNPLFDGISATICHLGFTENERYCDQMVILQRNFNWLAKLPEGHTLARKFIYLPKDEWTWATLGHLTKRHLAAVGYGDQAVRWEVELSHAMGYSGPDQLPLPIAKNPHYFTFLPSGGRFAKKMLDEGIFLGEDEIIFQRLGDETRHWLYDHLLYGVQSTEAPIATK